MILKHGVFPLDLISYEQGVSIMHRINSHRSFRQDVSHHDVKPYSTFHINGMSNVTINNIGKDATIIKNGMGNLTILGKVSEGVKFIIDGMGNVVFQNRPPQSVLNKIEKSGIGHIQMPGGYSPIPTQPQPNNNIFIHLKEIINNLEAPWTSLPEVQNEYSHSQSNHGDFSSTHHVGNMMIDGIVGHNHIPVSNDISVVYDDGLARVTRNGVITTYVGNNVSFVNNEIYIDGRIVTETDPRIIYVEHTMPSTHPNLNTFTSTHSFIRSALPRDQGKNVATVEKPIAKQTDILNNYSPSMQAYLNSFQNKEKNTDKLKNISLSNAENELLEAYLDPISNEIINIPVQLNERLYDLDTLLDIQRKNKKDPFNNYEFTLRDIQPARKESQAIQTIVQQIKDHHEKLEVTQKEPKYNRFGY